MDCAFYCEAGPVDVPDWKLRNARVAKERCEKLKEKHPEAGPELAGTDFHVVSSIVGEFSFE